MKFIIATLFFSVFVNNIFAKRFANNFLEFELPVGWSCVMEATEWVCQSEVKERGREAIIIFAAKKRGKMDSLEYYQVYLKRKKQYKLPGGKIQVSEPKYSRVNKINNHRWIDALHLSSEIPGFYTRYLATVKEDLGVAMTFSVARENYSNYKGVFDKVISSIRVFRKRGANYDSKNTIASSNSKKSLLEDTEFLPEDNFNILARKKGAKKSSSSIGDGKDSFLYVIIGLVIVALFFFKKR